MYIAGLMVFSLINNGILSADRGAGQTGNTIYLGYDGSWLSYREIVNKKVLDRDTGWINGISAEVRGDSKFLFIRTNLNSSWTSSAKYSGAIQNYKTGETAPYSTSTPEEFYQWELNMGFKALNFSTATLTPYAGFGYRDWLRGQNTGSDYQENYEWWYIPLGLNLAYGNGDWLFILDGAAEFMINPKMTATPPALDRKTFKIKSRPGYRAELTIRYNVYRNRSVKLFIFGTPYYQRWNIGASDAVILTYGGVPVQDNDGNTVYAFEPKSSTDIYGFRAGIGVNF